MGSCTDYYRSPSLRNSHRNWRKLSNSSIRLHLILMTRRERIDLAVMVGGFCLIGYAIKFYPMIWTALGVGAIGFAIAPAGKLIVKGWMLLSKAIGYVMSRVLLTLIFFVFLTPIAWFYRLSTKNALDLKRKNGSLFKDRNHQYQASDLENPW